MRVPEAERELGYFLNNAGPHALPLVPLPRPGRHLLREEDRGRRLRALDDPGVAVSDLP